MKRKKSFTENYEKSANHRYGIKLIIDFTKEAKGILLNAHYPRNIRQFRDITYATIDAALPLINHIPSSKNVTAVVDIEHIPFYMFENIVENEIEDEKSIAVNDDEAMQSFYDTEVDGEEFLDKMILCLNRKGLGPRRIARVLGEKGGAIP